MAVQVGGSNLCKWQAVKAVRPSILPRLSEWPERAAAPEQERFRTLKHLEHPRRDTNTSGSRPNRSWALAGHGAPQTGAPPDRLSSRAEFARSRSSATFSWAQARDLFFAPSWHPEDHPAMPQMVARGRKPDVRACGSCHRAELKGMGPIPPIAGRSPSYLMRQLWDLKNGARAEAASAAMKPIVNRS